jgi:colanic acid/amylovoran biosynthesis protein
MNILILNVHSALNLGDDAIMRATLLALESKYPAAKITIAANDPDSWTKFRGIKICSAICTWVADCRLGLWRQRFFLTPFVILFLCLAVILYRLINARLRLWSQDMNELLAAYYNADLVMSCAGGNFYANSMLSPGFIWNLITLGFAIGLGKRVIMLPQSIGPIEYRWQRYFARIIFDRVSLMMVREPESQNFVNSTLKLKTSPMLFPDLAFGLPEVDSWLMDGIITREGSLKIGVTLIDRASQNPDFHEQQQYEDALCSLLINLHQHYHASIFLLIQCYGPSPDQDDRQVTFRMYERLIQHIDQVFVLNNLHDAREIKSTIQALDVVIGTRMHTAIFALSTATPVIVIGYQPKTCGMMRFFGLPQYCINIEEISNEALEGLFSELYNNIDAVTSEASAYQKNMCELINNLPNYI